LQEIGNGGKNTRDPKPQIVDDVAGKFGERFARHSFDGLSETNL